MSAERPVTVLGLALALAAGAAGAAVPAAGSTAQRARGSNSVPLVQTMVVGIGGAVLAPARELYARAGSVRVGARSCAVAAGTPLAVLIALERAGGPRFALHDYGHCGSSPASSAELFVDSLGGERNSGADGWEYKVDGRAGSSGAGDPSGPQGDGRRLAAGERVLWFWCLAAGAGCQRTLEIVPFPASVAPGAALTVSVRAYENEGRSIPAAGVRVTLDGASASTAGDGRATLAAPSTSGRYALGAAHSGLVPAFPREVLVR